MSKNMFERIVVFAVCSLLMACSPTGDSSSSDDGSDGGNGAQSPTQMVLSSDDVSVTEGFSSTLKLTLDKPATRDMSFIWQISESAGRFVNSTGSIVIPAGASETLFAIEAAQNQLYDGEATAAVHVTDQSKSLRATTYRYTVIDADPLPYLSVDNSTAIKGSRIYFRAHLSGPASRDVTFNYATADASAKAGVDYHTATGQGRIPAGTTEVMISVITINNSTTPIDKDISFTLQISAADVVPIADSTGIGTIVAGDSSLAQISFSTRGDSAKEKDGRIQIPLELSAPLSRNATVSFQLGGAALRDADYTVDQTEITFIAGETRAHLTLNLIEDGLYEASEVMTLKLIGSSNAGLGEIREFALTIIDEDTLPNLSIADAQSVEGADLNFSLSLDRVSGADTMVSVKTVAGTADETRYTPKVATFLIPAGQVVSNFKVPTIHDNIYSANGSLSLVMTTVIGATIVRGTATGVITDPDPMPSVQFTVSEQSVGAGQTDVTVTIQMSEVSGAEVTVPFVVSGSATPGVDHNLSSGAIKVAARESTASVTFQVFGRPAAGKTIRLDMQPPAGAVLGSRTSHIIRF